MNQSQLKYARERAATILKHRKEVLTKKHTTPAVKLSCDEKLAALAAGKFKADKNTRGSWWHQAITFTAEKPEKFAKDKHDAELAVLNADYDKLVDELVLGDNEQALALLKAFEAAAAA